MTDRALEPLYEDTRARIVALVTQPGRGTAVEPASAAVPACPGWTVRDVISHVTALYADVMAGNLDGAGTDAWTAAQVEARRALTLDEILREWDESGPQLAAMLDDFPGRYGHQVIADLAAHEHDIRGALHQPGARQSAAVVTAIEFLMRSIVAPGAAALGVDPLEVSSGTGCWVVGSGDPNTEPGDPTDAIAAAIATGAEPAHPTRAPVGRVTADPFELFRSFTGRRSLEQICQLGWSTDPDPFLCLFDLWPFTLRSDDLVE